MKAKKLLALVGVLVVALPSVALAYHGSQVETTIVEGHTVFTDVLSESEIPFAAIAGTAAKRTTVGGVSWFGDQELFAPVTAQELAAGHFVIASATGEDAPFQHMDADYVESYRVTDPNNREWVIDHYAYEVCTIDDGTQVHEVPCMDVPEDAESPTAFQGSPAEGQPGDAPGQEPENYAVDLDGDGHPDDLDGDGAAETGDNVLVVVHHLYVVEIGAPTPDTCTSQGEYNFVLAVRLDGFDPTSLVPASLPDGSTADTTQVDLWFSEQRPQEPPARQFLFEDSVGTCAP